MSQNEPKMKSRIHPTRNFIRDNAMWRDDVGVKVVVAAPSTPKRKSKKKATALVSPKRNRTEGTGLRPIRKSAPNLMTLTQQPIRRRQSVNELRIPNRKESKDFFESPYRTKPRYAVSPQHRPPRIPTMQQPRARTGGQKNAGWRTPTSAPGNRKQRDKMAMRLPPQLSLSNLMADNLFDELDHTDLSSRMNTPPKPKRQHAIARSTPKTQRKFAIARSTPKRDCNNQKNNHIPALPRLRRPLV